jgi:hypothetical protein
MTISRYCPFKYTYKVYNDTAYKLKFALRRGRWMKWNHLSTGYIHDLFLHCRLRNSDGQCNCTLGPGGKTKCLIVLHEAEFLDKIQTKVKRVFFIFTVNPTALPWSFYFFKLTQSLTVFTVQLLYTVKEKVGKPVENQQLLFLCFKKSIPKPQV